MEKDLHIKNELEELDAKLYSIHFRRKEDIHPGYFDKLEHKVFNTLQEQLNSEKAMDSYFSTMQDKVLSEVRVEKRIFKLSYLTKIAALFILLMGSWFVFEVNIGNIDTPEDSFVENLEDEEIMYLLSEYSTPEELALLVGDTESDIILPDDSEAILEYLDATDIIEQLEL